MNYEYPLILRNKIKLLEKLMIIQNIINVKIENADLLAIHQNTISIMRFRNSNSYGIKSIFFEDINEFFSIIYRFYEEINLPKQFYVICTCFSYDLTPYLKLKNDNKEFDNSILEFLKQIFFRMFHVEPKITMFHVEHNNFENELNSLQENQLFHVEHKAVKDVKEIKSLLLLLLKNAENFSTTSLHQKNNTKNLFAEIQTNFQLNKIPKLIEIYDNSHINGTDAVGVLVAADVNGFNKSLYKKFYINNNKNGDDYDMMKEVITRRLERLRSRKDPMPDLLIIDGGPGQLSVSYKILLEYQKNGHFLDLEIISIAKGIKRSGDEKFYIIENSSPIDISSNQKLFYYLQNLRNEAHRFAVASHIKKRDKKMTESCLDHVIGIGPKKKKALLNYFGSTWNIKNASAEEIKNVIKVSLELAKAVINSIK